MRDGTLPFDRLLIKYGFDPSDATYTAIRGEGVVLDGWYDLEDLRIIVKALEELDEVE